MASCTTRPKGPHKAVRRCRALRRHDASQPAGPVVRFDGLRAALRLAPDRAILMTVLVSHDPDRKSAAQRFCHEKQPKPSAMVRKIHLLLHCDSEHRCWRGFAR
jgi:hypothetical protein